MSLKQPLKAVSEGSSAKKRLNMFNCSVFVDSGDAGKKLDADLIGGSIGEIIGGGDIVDTGFIRVDDANTNGAWEGDPILSCVTVNVLSDSFLC